MPQFQRRRQQRRIRRIGERIDFNHRTGHHNPQVMNGNYQEIMYWGNYNNPQLQHRPDTPVNILREAFNEFIVNENIESNTLGIEIVYLENEGDTIAKNITIIKRKYDEQYFNRPQPATQTRRINNNDANHYLNINDINQAAHYPNTELNNLINQVRGFYRILQITLCEIYNDDPISVARRGTRNRSHPNHINRYNLFTIPIRLLYRDMDPAMVPVRQIQRWEPGYVPPVLTPEQIALEEQRELEREQRALEREQAGAALAIQRQQSRRDQTPEQQAALLEDPFFNNYENLGEGENIVNPDPLQVVDNPELLNRPITSYHWPGICQICLDNDTTQPLCRVDCKQRNRDGSLVPIGHIFHCECINAYHNTRTGYGWNNKCPLCNQRDYPNITSMVQLTPDKLALLPTSFGKHSFGKRKGKTPFTSVDSDIKYLLKK